MHVLAGGDGPDAVPPAGKDLLVTPGIGADAERPADMIQHDARLRKGAGEADDILKLRVVEPRLEGEVERGEPGEALAEGRIAIEAGRRVGVAVAHIRARVEPGGVADTAVAAVAGRDLGPQHILDRGAEREVREANDAGAGLRLAVAPGRAHRGGAVDELDLADRRLRFRPARPVHRAAFDEDRRAHIVAAAGVLQQLVQQVAVEREVPEVMVRIDDRQVRLQDFLLRRRQPGVIDGGHPRLDGVCGHSSPISSLTSGSSAAWSFASRS